MLKQITIPIDALLLDPNNPRFIKDLKERVTVDDSQLERSQAKILKTFSKLPVKVNSEDDVTDEFTDEFADDVLNIKSLYESMVRMGYVAVDRIVVRSIEGLPTKYLVLEGNRRIAAVKTILFDFDEELEPLGIGHSEDRDSVREKRETFENIPAVQLEDGLSDQEMKERVATILGIRHHGSLLAWEPLPRAFNIFTQYMEQIPTMESFTWKNPRAESIGKRFSIGPSTVIKALRTYIAYVQARASFSDVKESHFSLIEAAVVDKSLRAGYFIIDDETFLLQESSLSKLALVCQFATRDSGIPTLTRIRTKKICPDPKAFGQLGKLVHSMHNATYLAVKEYAIALINRVESEDDLEMTIEQARADLSGFFKRIDWAAAMGKLLVEQSTKLDIELYSGDGVQLLRKEVLKKTFGSMRKILEI